MQWESASGRQFQGCLLRTCRGDGAKAIGEAAGASNAVIDLLYDCLKAAQPRTVVAIDLVLDFHVGVA
jgi:hypothetical protein